MIMRAVVGNNVLIDYLICREPHFEKAALLMELGYLKELELWIGTSQITDLIYVITDGGRASESEYAKKVMRSLKKMVRIYATDDEDYDAVASSSWDDIEDAFVHQTALKVHADAIITRDECGFRLSTVKAFDCDELFSYLEEEKGFVYESVAL